MSGKDTNTVIYFGLFDGHDPNPSKDPGYIIMSSFLVFYKWCLQNFPIWVLKSVNIQSNQRLNFYFPTTVVSIIFVPISLIYINLKLTAAKYAKYHLRATDHHQPFAFFSRCYPEVNEKKSSMEGCSERRLRSVITCNHVQLETHLPAGRWLLSMQHKIFFLAFYFWTLVLWRLGLLQTLKRSGTFTTSLLELSAF